MEKKEFKKLFPNLHYEMESGASKVDLGKVKEPQSSIEPSYKEDRKYTGYQPNIVDFIRRCRKPQEAEEIISFLENKGEITKEEAIVFRKQLNEDGLRSFGPRKKLGDYEK